MDSSAENWTNYVQINFFNRSLDDLKRYGADLQQLLNQIGSDGYSIGEGKVCRNTVETGTTGPPVYQIGLPSTITEPTKIHFCSTPRHPSLKFDVARFVSRPMSPIESNETELIFEDVEPEYADFETKTVTASFTGIEDEDYESDVKVQEEMESENVEEEAEVENFSIQNDNEEVAHEDAEEKEDTFHTIGDFELTRPPEEPNNHRIVCQFDDCEEVINWRPKFGKLRLLDHALHHFDGKLFKCQLCAFESVTSSSIRYHYRKKHPGEAIKGFGYKNIGASSEELHSLWNRCFSAHVPLVGTLYKRKVR